jgi:hypothetical protein
MSISNVLFKLSLFVKEIIGNWGLFYCRIIMERILIEIMGILWGIDNI